MATPAARERRHSICISTLVEVDDSEERNAPLWSDESADGVRGWECTAGRVHGWSEKKGGGGAGWEGRA